MLRRLLLTTLTLALGAAAAGGLFWALLNVPESNAMALALSAMLILLIVTVSGLAIGGAAAFAHSLPPGRAAARAVASLPNFFVGLAFFALLWLITGAVAGWWTAHRGEIDAVILRYLGRTETNWLHTTVSWKLRLVRWALGGSIVVALVTTGVHSGIRAVGAGLRLSVRLLPLAVAIIVVLLITLVLWPATGWRPESLPPTWLQPAVAAVKLAGLFGAAAALCASALLVYSSSRR